MSEDFAETGFEPTTVRTRIEKALADPLMSTFHRDEMINEILVDEVGQIAFDKMNAGIEVDALRLHAQSPVTLSGEGPAAEELEAQADEIEQSAHLAFESSRSYLVDTVKDLHESGRVVLTRGTWAAVSTLDTDEVKLIDDIPEAAQLLGAAPESVDARVDTIDLAKPVSVKLDKGAQIQPRERGRDHGMDSEVEQDRAFDEPVAAHIEQHRQQAKSRPSTEPTPVGSFFADWMRKHGRNPDGSAMDSSIQPETSSPEF